MNRDTYRKLLNQKFQPESPGEISFDDVTIREALNLWVENREKCIKIYGPINEWDLKNVNNIPNLFTSRIAFNNVTIRKAVNLWFEDREKCIEIYGHISQWKTSAVTDMSNLFVGRTDFNENINQWDISNVKDFTNFLKGCTSFDQDLFMWHLMRPEYVQDAFEGCRVDMFDCPIWYGMRLISVYTFFIRVPSSFITKVRRYYPKIRSIHDIDLVGRDLDKYDEIFEGKPPKKKNEVVNHDIKSWSDFKIDKNFFKH